MSYDTSINFVRKMREASSALGKITIRFSLPVAQRHSHHFHSGRPATRSSPLSLVATRLIHTAYRQGTHPLYSSSTGTSCASFPKNSLRKLFYLKTNLLQAVSQVKSAVHNRGHGYSNSFTLCRGCTLYPQDPRYLSWSAMTRHTSSMRYKYSIKTFLKLDANMEPTRWHCSLVPYITMSPTRGKIRPG